MRLICFSSLAIHLWGVREDNVEYLFAISEQLSAVPWMILCVLACWDHLRWPKRGAVAFCIAYTAWLALCGVLCVNFDWSTNYTLVPSFLGASFLLIRISRFSKWKTLWLISTGFYLAATICYLSLAVDVQTVGDTFSTSRLAWPGMATQWGLGTLFVLILWRPLRKRLPDFLEEESYDNFWHYAWLLPALNALVIVFCMPVDTTTLLVRRIGLLVPLILGTQFILVGLAYALAARLIIQSNERMREAENNRQLTVALQQARYQQARIDDARRARQDLRHQVRAVIALLHGGDQSSAVEYLRRLDSGEQSDRIIYCENAAIDPIAAYYLGRAKAAGARLDVRLDIPKAVAIPGIDLVVIIGNVLENAAQMVERDVETGRLLRDGAFVTAKAQLINGSMLVFTCDNSCTVAPRQNKAGDFVTSAGDNGLGLASVRDAAGRNGGIAQFGYSQGVFSCSIVVQRAQG